jgi:hypothetical protein
MTREKRLAKPSGTGETPSTKLMESILEDVIKAGALSHAQWRALSPNPLIPLALPVSGSRQYWVTQVGVDAAHALTKQSWKAFESLRQTVEQEAFARLSFQAIGDTIYGCRSSLPTAPIGSNPQDAVFGDEFYATLIKDYQARLHELSSGSSLDVDRHIPCHLFHSDQAIPAFSVGPVRFLPRTQWLDSFVGDPDVRELIHQVDDGRLELESLRARITGAETDRRPAIALDVLRTLRRYSWVATVRMEGHERAQSHFKASVVVGLAIDAVGLRFQVEDARRFGKAGRPHLFVEDRLATTLDGRVLSGSSVQVPGLRGRPGALAAKMATEQSFLDDAGVVLQHYVDGRTRGKALHLVERWANALYWIGEARREASDFMAVVDYGCAADGLSGAGGNAKEMTAFADAALLPVDEVSPGGSLTVDAAVNIVYREGRNKLAHGETSGLLEDLAEPRAVGEALLAALFDAVTPVLADLLKNEPNVSKVEEKVAYRLLKAKLISKKAA